MMIEFINRPMRLFSLFFVRRQFLTLAPFRILQVGSGVAQLSAVMRVWFLLTKRASLSSRLPADGNNQHPDTIPNENERITYSADQTFRFPHPVC